MSDLENRGAALTGTRWTSQQFIAILYTAADQNSFNGGNNEVPCRLDLLLPYSIDLVSCLQQKSFATHDFYSLENQ